MLKNNIKLVSRILALLLILNLILLHLRTQYDIEHQNDIDELPFWETPPDFTLPSITGKNYTYSSDEGLVRLVSFIYTKCPGNNGCALTTLLMRNILEKLVVKGLESGIRLISVDFDYINDTMEDLIDYANRYTNDTVRWKFLLGDKNQTDKVASDWNVYFEVNNATSSNLSLNHGPELHEDPYLHQIVVFLVDQEGVVRDHLLGNSWRVDDTVKKIEFLLGE